MYLHDLIPEQLLADMLEQRMVRVQRHPDLPLQIYNYSEQAAYSRCWNEATLNCRGLIIDGDGTILARPFPKFFNHAEPGAPELHMDAPVSVTDKLDGSLGILYPALTGYAIATRGSFTSDQALHATEIWQERYADFEPLAGATYLFEIIYPANRIVIDYGGADDLYLLGAIGIESGLPVHIGIWPGPRAETHPYRTLAEALEAEPRENAEGYVVYFPDTNERVKLKQDDYVALHRIMTGTNARNVWEVAAVHACRDVISNPKHWGSQLGIDPARADEILAVGDDWLTNVPDEFYDWVHEVIDTVAATVIELVDNADVLVALVRTAPDRRAGYEMVSAHAFAREIMRAAVATDDEQRRLADTEILMRAWREACPPPMAPFARSEAIA